MRYHTSFPSFLRFLLFPNFAGQTAFKVGYMVNQTGWLDLPGCSLSHTHESFPGSKSRLIGYRLADDALFWI